MDPYLEGDMWQEFHERLANQISMQLLPLLAPDHDVPLDLQTAVDACFALVGYERLLDYSAPPPPLELDAADAAWVEERLSAAGVRA
jgi:hypothetical protein